jgi:predicted dehydrogenase
MVRIAVIGAGVFGIEHVRAYRHLPDVEVVGMVEPDPARRARFVELADIGERVPLYESVEALLERGAPQAASVVVPSRAHREVAVQLMGAGVDVLVEKPFARDIADARAIARVALETGRLCLPGHVLRFSEPHRDLHAQFGAGTLGEVRLLTLRRDRSRSLAVNFPLEHPASLTGVHDIDLAIWLTGQPVVRVRAVERSIMSGTPDQFSAELSHADGTLSLVSGAYLLPLDQPGLGYDRIEVFGSQDWRTLEEVTPDDPPPPDDPGRNPPLVNELAHFASVAARGDLSTVCTPADGVHAVEVVDAVLASAAGGGTPVDIPATSDTESS